MTPRPRKRGKRTPGPCGRRLAFIAAGIIASTAVVAVPRHTADAVGVPERNPMAPPPVPAPAESSTAGPPPAPDSPAPPPVKSPAIGAYLDYGPRGIDRMAELGKWLGGTELRVGHTYLPGDRWSNIEGAPRFLESWAAWRKAEDDRLFVLNVPMLERNEEGVSDREVRGLLRQGAAGAFDEHFRVLAKRLVDLEVPDTVVVLGWEMNGITYTHRCGPDPESWKAYWKRIVTVMRSVPGQKFSFDFAPSRGRDAIPWTRCYPGDDQVDIIGMDAYDQPRGMTFDEQVNEEYGLQHHVDFAKEHKKPVSYPEWGLFRNGDNDVYMRRMLKWMDEHKPLYNTVTDYCPHGVWQCEDNPRSAKVYREALSGSPVNPTPRPTGPELEGARRCSPLDLGRWIEYWMGGKLCLRVDWWERPGT
ncbi:glycoside hydrolase family 26 protein [Streptomyces aureocirculatus]|uniref:glycoside hydrolase family 26 protein n=1 Tax=Streptomyces aureocirculatus TaxID=67275 RepID=UPI000B154B70|nr:glycosyl hydrolase [Streptomyces aureocirculatus]